MDVMTLPDKLMIFSQFCQLLNYGLVAICLADKESRLPRRVGQAQGESG